MPANSIDMSTLVQVVFDHAELSNLFASTVSQLARQVLTINHQEEENIDAEQIQCGVEKLARHAVEAVWRPIVWQSLVHRCRTTASSKLVSQLSGVATARAAQRGFLTEWAVGALLCRRLKHTSQMVVQARAVLCIQPVWRDWLYKRHSQRALPKILSGIRSSHWQRSVDSNAARTISKHLGSSALQVCNALGWQPPSSCRTSMELSIGQAVWHKEGLQWFEGKITSCNSDGSVDLTTKYGSVVGAQQVQTDPLLCGLFPESMCTVSFGGSERTVSWSQLDAGPSTTVLDRASIKEMCSCSNSSTLERMFDGDKGSYWESDSSIGRHYIYVMLDRPRRLSNIQLQRDKEFTTILYVKSC
jgi:hypothetical protein